MAIVSLVCEALQPHTETIKVESTHCISKKNMNNPRCDQYLMNEQKHV